LNEEDPVRRAKIMELIEGESKNLEGKMKKKQELSKKFNFDPGKKVKNLMDAIKKALDKKDKSGVDGGGGGSRSSGTSHDPNNSDDESYSDSDDNVNLPSAKSKKKKGTPQT
jgi:hypothetical protein